MIARIAKLVGYSKAPTASYLLRHPIRGTRALRAARRGLSRGAMTRAGAAALAVPLGYWLVRRWGGNSGGMHENVQAI